MSLYLYMQKNKFEENFCFQSLETEYEYFMENMTNLNKL